MKIELSQSELSLMLEALNPFTNPQEWENEKFDKLIDILKSEIHQPFIRSMKSETKIFYPGEWKVSTIIKAIASNEYSDILVVGDEYYYYEIFNICKSHNYPKIERINKNFIKYEFNVSCQFLNVKYENWENSLRGHHYGCMFL